AAFVVQRTCVPFSPARKGRTWRNHLRCKARAGKPRGESRALRQIDPQIESHISAPPENNARNPLEPESYRLSLDLCATPTLDTAHAARDVPQCCQERNVSPRHSRVSMSQ